MASYFHTALTREVTDALKNTFDDVYPDELLQNIMVGPDFQMERQSYPCIYIVFTESFIQNVGLGHQIEGDDIDESGLTKTFKQFYFQGSLTFNCMALTTTGRDALADNLLNVLAFGRQNPYMKRFHDDIYDNDWILLYLMTERIIPGQPNLMAAPWNPDEQIYYRNYTIDITGEFFSDPYTAEVIRISTINFFPYRDDQPVPKGSQLPADIHEPWQG